MALSLGVMSVGGFAHAQAQEEVILKVKVCPSYQALLKSSTYTLTEKTITQEVENGQQAIEMLGKGKTDTRSFKVLSIESTFSLIHGRGKLVKFETRDSQGRMIETFKMFDGFVADVGNGETYSASSCEK